VSDYRQTELFPFSKDTTYLVCYSYMVEFPTAYLNLTFSYQDNDSETTNILLSREWDQSRSVFSESLINKMLFEECCFCLHFKNFMLLAFSISARVIPQESMKQADYYTQYNETTT
jgi:hypothetical protein